VTRRGWAFVLAAALLAAAFAYQNRAERVAVEAGPLHLYAVPLAVLLFAAFLLGMTAMLLLSLPHDRRTRELLRERGLLDAPPVATHPPPSRWPDAHSGDPPFDAHTPAFPRPDADTGA